MNKKVVVLGGGTGLSTLLRGLKQFPLDITAIVSVCDDGQSTGVLRKEFNIPRIYEPTLLLPIGYIDRKPSILHNRRNEVETFTKYDTY